MARPPVDSRLQNIEKMQKNMEVKLDKMLDGLENPSSTNEKIQEIEKIDCECEQVTTVPAVTVTQKEKPNNNGESSDK